MQHSRVWSRLVAASGAGRWSARLEHWARHLAESFRTRMTMRLLSSPPVGSSVGRDAEHSTPDECSTQLRAPRSAVSMSMGGLLTLMMFSLLLSASFSLVRGASVPDTFAQAGQLYEQGDFAGARARYQQLTRGEALSANLLLNLGNTNFRLGDPGRAILAYEQALNLEPSHHEATANLALVRSRSGAKVLPAWPGESALLPLSATAYSLLFASTLWAALLAAAGLLLWKKTPGLLAVVCMASTVLAAYAATALWRQAERQAIAIVVAPEATARLEPADRGGAAETLPAGSEVRVLSEHGAWIYCELPGGGRGWLARPTLERLNGETSAS